MSQWRAQAIRLFPENRRGSFAFQRRNMTIYQIFFELLYEFDEKIASGDFEWISRVFEYVEWCHRQKKRAPDIWNAAATAFLEHMADEDERAVLTPRFVKPPIFKDMWQEFMKRREREGRGKAIELLKDYNSHHGTQFTMQLSLFD